MSLTSSLAGGGQGPKGDTGATGAAGAAGPNNIHLAQLAANFTSVTTAMAAITAGGTSLSVPVISGHRYKFEVVLMMNDASGLEGAVFDFDASTAAATNFRAFPDDGATGAFAGFTTTLATDITGTGITDDTLVIRGSFEPSSTGTFALRAAQSTHISGTLTVYRGSSLQITEVTE